MGLVTTLVTILEIVFFSWPVDIFNLVLQSEISTIIRPYWGHSLYLEIFMGSYETLVACFFVSKYLKQI